jgi:hypothetical protein
MHIPAYIGLVNGSEEMLRDAYLQVSNRHRRDADIHDGCMKQATFTLNRIKGALELGSEFGAKSSRDPKILRDSLFRGMRVGGIGIVRDLHDLSILANQCLLYWTALYQGIRALHEREAESICHESVQSVEQDVSWLTTQLEEAAPQALTIPPHPVHHLVTFAKKIPTTAVLPNRPGPALVKAATLTGAVLIGYRLGRRSA